MRIVQSGSDRSLSDAEGWSLSLKNEHNTASIATPPISYVFNKTFGLGIDTFLPSS